MLNLLKCLSHLPWHGFEIPVCSCLLIFVDNHDAISFCNRFLLLTFEIWLQIYISFSLSPLYRRVKLLSLEGCSLLTIRGLELVVLSWKELQRLRVMSCNNIKDTEVTPELATLFSVLKELIWRPDSRSLLSSNLAGTGMGRKGDRFFKRSKD